MYSPGSLNVTLVDAVPLKVMPFSWRSIFLTSGRSFVNVTVPGPRYLCHITVTGVLESRFLTPEGVPEFVKIPPSSASHTVSGSGLPTVTVRTVDRPCGPRTDGPFSSSLRRGGVLPSSGDPSREAVLTNGETS